MFLCELSHENMPISQMEGYFVEYSGKYTVEILNVFNILTLKQIFWKTKNVFKKLEYCFLVESTKVEITSFP